ncbi:MAG: hypothetical protein GVY09_13790 [Gammaproteobacteria bacterium]|jgi:hypothetical protein|nr:hypothetical protein [Gammaproteobacteria bacterium]
MCFTVFTHCVEISFPPKLAAGGADAFLLLQADEKLQRSFDGFPLGV